MRVNVMVVAAVAVLNGVMGLNVAKAEEASAVSFNAGVVSDYRYRGISQTRLKPTVQAGVDATLPQGFYVGAWGSGIQWIKDGGGDASMELDLYGGWKGEVSPGLTLDLGMLKYQYPSNKLSPSANTLEVYGALSYSIFTAKYSHSTSNLFGFAGSKGSGYVDLSAAIDAGGGYTITPHLGYQRVKNGSGYSYTDYGLTVSKDWEGFAWSAGVIGTDSKAYQSPSGKNLGRAGLVLGVKKTF